MKHLLGCLAFALFFSFINSNVEVQDCPQQGKAPSHDGESAPPTGPGQLPRQGNTTPITYYNTPLSGADYQGYSKTPIAYAVTSECFDDNIPEMEVLAIKEIDVYWTSDWLVGLTVTYVTNSGNVTKEHFNYDGSVSSERISLEEKEDIIGVKFSNLMFGMKQISFVTQNRDTMETETHGPFGPAGTESFTLSGLVLGFHGCVDKTIRGLGFYYTDRAVKGPKFGGPGGTYWEDISQTQYPPIVNIDYITIWHGSAIDAIQVQYIGLSGKSVAGWKHGGSGGERVTFDLEPGEYLVQLDTKSSSDLLDEVTFITQKQDGTQTTYGPYGTPSEESIPSTAFGKIIGFYGSSGDVVDSLGVFFAEAEL